MLFILIIRALGVFYLPIVIVFYLFVIRPGVSCVNCFSFSVEEINMTFFVN